MENKTDKVVSYLDQFLVYVSCSNRDLSGFSGAYLMDPSFYIDDEGPKMSWLGTTPEDINYRWKINALTGHIKNYPLCLFQFKSLTHTEIESLRRRYPEFNRRMASRSFEVVSSKHEAIVTKEGNIIEGELYFGHRKDKTHFLFDPSERYIHGKRYGLLPKDKKLDEERAKIYMGVAYMEPTFWTVSASYNGTPSIKIPTDPSGVLEMWKMRDLPSGKKRRPALLHWVSQHWRKSRSDPEVEDYVRKHLRGNTEFETHGLHIVISASSEDAVENFKLIEERTSLKKQKRTRRRRKSA